MFRFPCTTEFLQDFRVGRRETLERVYWAYLDEVETVVRSLSMRYRRSAQLASSAPDVGELVQEVFVRAFSDKARHGFDASRSFGPYLGTLARNLFIDWTRKQGRELTIGDFDDAFGATQPVDIDSGWADEEAMAIVSHYLAELPAELLEIHEQRFVACRTQEEACAALGISRAQLRTRERHLRDGLRRELRRAGAAFSQFPSAADQSVGGRR